MISKHSTSQKFNIGNCQIGGDAEVSVQSMTSTSTKDIEATVQQCLRMAKAGAQMIRMTARDVKEAENLKIIKDELYSLGFDIPIIADVHFNPKVAEVAAKLIDKVRINPGNYMDRKTGKTDWSEEEFKRDQENIKARLSDLVQICKEHQTAIRIGVNHGSLSERMINRYGDTAEGMVESALEFIRIFMELSFEKLVISLKASNVIIMVQANELMAQRMQKENLKYPLHLGVTEAGDAEDGRIKSAVGIGSLLSQGIGQTIRVSLTEEPEYEIPVAKKILKASLDNSWISKNASISFARRKSKKLHLIGGEQVPVVISSSNLPTSSKLKADYRLINQTLQSNTDQIQFQKLEIDDLFNENTEPRENYYFEIFINQWKDEWFPKLKKVENLIIVINKQPATSVLKIHDWISKFETYHLDHPLILKMNENIDEDEALIINSSIISGPFLLNGNLDGLWIESEKFDTVDLSFGILQASRLRVSKTEYIACPSCGRTLFNIQQKLQEIKSKTEDLKGLKIAVMGCIVNGLGEMADADYGYIGAGKGKVNIYKKHLLMRKNVAENNAADALLEIIRQDL